MDILKKILKHILMQLNLNSKIWCYCLINHENSDKRIILNIKLIIETLILRTFIFFRFTNHKFTKTVVLFYFFSKSKIK